MFTPFARVQILGLVVFMAACVGETDDTNTSGHGSGLGGASASGGASAAGATTSPNSGGNAGSNSGGNSGGNSATTTAVPTSCSKHADCALTSVTCCGTCGAPTPADVIALAVTGLDAYRTQACGGNKAAPCPACAQQANPDLFASCEAGTCKIVDLKTAAVSACSAAADCGLRAKACCECGAAIDPWSLVAIAKTASADFSPLVCDGNTACPECMPLYPTDLALSCQSGHCSVLRQ